MVAPVRTVCWCKFWNGQTISKEVLDSLKPKFRSSFEFLSIANIHQQQLKSQHRIGSIQRASNLEELKSNIYESDQVDNLYKARFTSSSHKSSSAWTYSHLKYQVDPVSDQAARDNLALSIGLLPQMHDVCFHCKSSTTTPGFDPQSHCVGCAASNVHPVAGKIVELAVIKACKKVFTLKNGSQPNYKDQPSWDPVRQVPKLRSAGPWSG